MNNKRIFKPTLWATVVTLVALIVLCALGSWQIKRLQWKQNILAQIDVRSKQERIDFLKLDLSKEHHPLELLNYTPVTVTGSFMHDAELHLIPRTYKNKVGYHVYTPIKMDNGETVLVNRGWANDEVSLNRPQGRVTVTGILHTAFEKNYFTPENTIEKQIWYWIDLPAIKKYFDLGVLSEIIVFSDLKEKEQYPVGQQLVMKIANNHLQYACFWFAMAAIMMMIYFLYHWKIIKDEEVI